MDIQVEKLRQVLDLVAAAIPRGKVTLPITSSVLFSEGRVTASNLEFWISVDLPELGDLSPGDGFVLPHRALTEALKFTPGRQVVSLVPDEDRVVLESPGSRLSLVKPGEPHDFPPMPQPEGDGFTVDGDRLVRGLLEVLPYASTSDARAAVLTGVALRLDEALELVAADGYRLAMHRPDISLSGVGTGHMAVVPGNAVRVLGQLWRKGDKPPDIDAARIVGETANGGHSGSVDIGRLAVARRNIRVVEDGDHIRFSFGAITLCAGLLPGTFPRYQELVPEDTGGTQVSVSAEELLRVVNQVANIASGGRNIVRLRWAGDRPAAGSGQRLIVSARDADVGDVEVVIMPANVEGADGEIAFDLRYLQQYLRGKTHVVTIAPTFIGEGDEMRSGPGIFTHRGSPMVMMMPMLAPAASEEPPDEDEPPESGGEPEAEEPTTEEPAGAVGGDEEEQPAEPAVEEEQSPPRRRRRRSQPNPDTQE